MSTSRSVTRPSALAMTTRVPSASRSPWKPPPDSSGPLRGPWNRIVRELLKASQAGGDDWVLVPKPATMPVWWAAHLLSGVLGNLSMRVSWRGMEDIGTWIDLAALPFVLMAGGLYIAYVLQVYRSQKGSLDML